ncbi:biosynthetic arginine decarboxylase [Thiohalobacter sp. IOR34]|uniref:biosynthetic arginine decarboxylase n=1 Tax=Thiohalobacter sp. IOR34 TaxID=3057176 RepID=UPI0025B02C40|nr:biosynthetic arginine decarboxylase [Thiohalobacter sp. IOR34]WJW75664.1 biosynthetic arginine decarboxylase [Thiohalobacter sp. IOR34]
MWTTDQAASTYALHHWGEGYFEISKAGHLRVRPHRTAGAAIDLYELAAELRDRGVSLPVLVRFDDILHDLIDTLSAAFEAARVQRDYRGRYTAVYPIKVNQQRSVVEQILAHGGERVGLEAGSKPELMAVLALSRPGGMIVCNGYKDREYVRLALIGRRLGLAVHLVIEKLSELDLVLEEAAALEVEPLLGVRVRLASLGAGKWQNTGGEKSKFGLHARQVLQLVERLRAAGHLGWLRLLHCHLGSQVANVRDIQNGMREVARYYAELHALGAPLAVVDVGGGLGVDYEGTASRSDCSVNYSVQEYANNVVQALAEICTEKTLPPPDIVTESGRAMTAHHAVLISNVTDIEQAPGTGAMEPPSEDEPVIVRTLWTVFENIAPRTALEAWHEAEYWLGEARTLYLHGVLSLAERARVESLYFAICHRLRPLLKGHPPARRQVLDELNDKLADKYFLNFSVFQSLPDVWAIGQIFPVMPLHRLDDPPTRRGVIQDLTCDSDGRIARYVDGEGVETTLPLHPFRRGEEYLLGVFLVGAYQEILGDMHNLFGDTDAVNVALDGEGGYRITQVEQGDTVDELLRYVHFDTGAMQASYRDKIAAAGLDEARARQYLAELEAGLAGYTYLED